MENPTLFDMFRATPVQSTLVTAVPVLLALAQLANSVFNELSFFVSVPFAIVIIGYSYLLTQYGLTRFRRRQIERELEA